MELAIVIHTLSHITIRERHRITSEWNHFCSILDMKVVEPCSPKLVFCGSDGSSVGHICESLTSLTSVANPRAGRRDNRGTGVRITIPGLNADTVLRTVIVVRFKKT